MWNLKNKPNRVRFTAIFRGGLSIMFWRDVKNAIRTGVGIQLGRKGRAPPPPEQRFCFKGVGRRVHLWRPSYIGDFHFRNRAHIVSVTGHIIINIAVVARITDDANNWRFGRAKYVGRRVPECSPYDSPRPHWLRRGQLGVL